MPRSRGVMRSALSLALLLALVSVIPAGAQQAQDKPPLDDRSWALFQRILGMVLRDYVEPRSPQDVIVGALKGAASSAGPECAYVPPEQVAAYQAAKANAVGLPLFVTKETDFARLIATYPGQDASVKAGDALRFMGDQSTYDLSYPQVLAALRGKAGEKVRCIFIKPDTWQSYTVTLERLAPPEPRWVYPVAAGGVLVLPSLEAPFQATLAKAMMATKGPVLVDLRGCADDDARLAFRWAGDLLGKIESPARKTSKGVVREPLAGQGVLAGRPLRVLVDGTTGRAGEVLAVALANAGATLVGAPTFGFAGYFQDFPLENGGLLRLNTAYFLGPDGEALKGHPIAPAIALTFPEAAKAGETYAAALKAPLPKAENGKAAPKEAPKAKSEGPSKHGGGDGR
jgi:carboxyl-terminal processing protease